MQQLFQKVNNNSFIKFHFDDGTYSNKLNLRENIENKNITKVSYKNMELTVDNKDLYLEHSFDVYPEDWKEAFLTNWNLRKIFSNTDNKQQYLDTFDQFLIKLDKQDMQIMRENYYLNTDSKDNTTFFTESANKVVPNNSENNNISFLIPKKMENNVVIAGGAIINNILSLKETDYDIYFVDDTGKKDIKVIIQNYCKWLDASFEITCYSFSNIALTFTIKINEKDIKIQLIKKLYHNAAHILCGFDLPACMFAYYKETYYMTTLSKLAITQRVNYVDPTMVSDNYCQRLMKYAIKKGFRVKAPGITKEEIMSNIDVEFITSIGDKNLKKYCNNLGLLIFYHLKYNNIGDENILYDSDYCTDYDTSKASKVFQKQFEYFININQNELDRCYDCTFEGISFDKYPINNSFRKFKDEVFDSSICAQLSNWNIFMDTDLYYNNYSSIYNKIILSPIFSEGFLHNHNDLKSIPVNYKDFNPSLYNTKAGDDRVEEIKKNFAKLLSEKAIFKDDVDDVDDKTQSSTSSCRLN
jgi:hypothetical protein